MFYTPDSERLGEETQDYELPHEAGLPGPSQANMIDNHFLLAQLALSSNDGQLLAASWIT